MSFLSGIILGIGWTSVLSELPGYLVCGLLFASAVLLAALSFLPILKRFSPYIQKTVRLVAGICLGIAWASFLSGKALEDSLPKYLEKRKIQVVGVVASLPHATSNGISFQFQVEEARTSKRTVAVPERIFLFKQHLEEHGQTIDVGQRWRFSVRLKRPHGTMNPGGFDFERWLFEHGLRATGSVIEDKPPDSDNTLLDAFVFTPMNLVNAIRSGLREKINQAIPDAECAGIITALVIGDQRAIPKHSWDIFSRTGVSHLVAISGLHITLVAGLLAGLAGFLWRRSFFSRLQLPLLLPAQKVAVIAGILAAIGYVLLAGAGIPARRTLAMIVIVGIALWTDRLVQVHKVLLLSAALILMSNPLALHQPGFWLSFIAVGMILYVAVRHHRHPIRMGALAHLTQWGQSFLRVQMAVTAGLFALTLFFWGRASIVGPIANALAIPLFSFLVTPLALLGSVLPGPFDTWILSSVDQVLSTFCSYLDWIGNLPYAVWTVPFPNLYLLAFAMLGALWLVAPKGWPVRIAGACCFLPILALIPTSPEEGTFKATVLDVGQGGAVLVETAHHRMLFDTGPAFGQSNAADRVIIPYLKSRGIDSLDRVVVSHADSDHSGGFDALMENIVVNDVISSMTLDAANIPAKPCLAGEGWEWDGIRFSILHPNRMDYINDLKTNELSCVIKVNSKHGSLLLTGDIEEQSEQSLVTAYGEKLHADVLLAPHHGSHTSSSMPFLTAVKPTYTIFQVGYRNPYHHPHPSVLKRYKSLDTTFFRSDSDGAVSITFDEDGIAAEAMRTASPRFWHTR